MLITLKEVLIRVWCALNSDNNMFDIFTAVREESVCIWTFNPFFPLNLIMTLRSREATKPQLTQFQSPTLQYRVLLSNRPGVTTS